MADVRLDRVENSLSGTLGGERVDLEFEVPRSEAGIRGTCLGVSVEGYWRIESNYDNLEPVGLFLGDSAGSPVFLRNEVHLTSHYALRYADLAGTIGEDILSAHIVPLEAPLSGRWALGIEGAFNGEAISVEVASNEDKSGIRLDGSVGAGRVTLDVTYGSIGGQYSAPAALFPLFVCTPLYFLWPPFETLDESEEEPPRCPGL